MIRIFMIAVVFSIVATTLNIYGQNAKQDGKYSEIPRELGCVLVLDQPNSPLKFQKIRFLVAEIDLKPHLNFVVGNLTNKKVDHFTVSFLRKSSIREWNAYGIATEMSVGKEGGNATVIKERGSYQNFQISETELLPLSEKVSQLFNSQKVINDSKLKIIWVALIRDVSFTDGSKFTERFNDSELAELID